MLTAKISPNQNQHLELGEIIEIIKANELELLEALQSNWVESDDGQFDDELPDWENRFQIIWFHASSNETHYLVRS